VDAAMGLVAAASKTGELTNDQVMLSKSLEHHNRYSLTT
jgi:hypothetical protein